VTGDEYVGLIVDEIRRKERKRIGVDMIREGDMELCGGGPGA
jgi:hypothetical protein